jgi:hypothetical protein
MATLQRSVCSLCLILPLTSALVSCTYRMGPPLETTAAATLASYTAAPALATPEEEIPTSTVALPSPQVIVVEPQLSPESPQPPRNHYSLTAVMDYDQHHVEVSQVINYTNRTDAALDDLVLMVEANRYQGTFTLKRLEIPDEQAPGEYTLEGNQLRLALPKSLPPGETLSLEIEFALQLPSPAPNPSTRPVPFGYTARQSNLVDWYPFIPPLHPTQGWLAHAPGYYGEHLAYEKVDFEVNLRIDGHTPVAPGVSTPSPADVLPLVVAASANPTLDGEWYRYRLENARNFSWSASHSYLVKAASVDGIQVYNYAFPYHEEAGDAVLDATIKALALYQELFGPYPHATLSVVEADFLDGMEYDGMYFLSNGFYNLYTGTPAEYLTAIAAHETAHQWWYGIVGNDQALEPWLDEALCTYTERLFYERYYPEALDWWWEYRIHYYAPKGAIDGSIYSYTYTTDAYRAYRDAVYLNGAVFLEELRQTIGDGSFFAFLKDYAQQSADKIASGEDFWRILGEHSQMDLTPLKDKYFTAQ